MNTEYILDRFKTNLETYLPTELNTIQVESGSSIVTPAPLDYKLGQFSPSVLTLYPSVQIYSPNSRENQDTSHFQLRSVWIRVIVWITENDLSNLHRFISRYTDGVSRVLRREDYYPPYVNNVVIGDTNNTDQYQTNVGYAQGTQIELTADYIMS